MFGSVCGCVIGRGIRNQLLAQPANGIFGADELDDTILNGGYYEWLWPGDRKSVV